jgi:hypothetical protein
MGRIAEASLLLGSMARNQRPGRQGCNRSPREVFLFQLPTLLWRSIRSAASGRSAKRPSAPTAPSPRRRKYHLILLGY